MVKSIGLDIVEVSRIKHDLDRYGERFVNRILGEKELRAYSSRRDKHVFLAGRFAAKEAVIKALGAYLTDRPHYSEIQIVNDASGQPTLELPESISRRMNNSRNLISITHEKNYAAAIAVFEEEK